MADDEQRRNLVSDYGGVEGESYFAALKDESFRVDHERESLAADRLSMRLLAVDDDDEAAQLKILQETLDFDMDETTTGEKLSDLTPEKRESIRKQTQKAGGRFCYMTALCLLAFGVIGGALWIGAEFIGPPNQPVGPYELIERQVRKKF